MTAARVRLVVLAVLVIVGMLRLAFLLPAQHCIPRFGPRSYPSGEDGYCWDRTGIKFGIGIAGLLMGGVIFTIARRTDA
jgi:hypothetical protein